MGDPDFPQYIFVIDFFLGLFSIAMREPEFNVYIRGTAIPWRFFAGNSRKVVNRLAQELDLV